MNVANCLRVSGALYSLSNNRQLTKKLWKDSEIKAAVVPTMNPLATFQRRVLRYEFLGDTCRELGPSSRRCSRPNRGSVYA